MKKTAITVLAALQLTALFLTGCKPASKPGDTSGIPEDKNLTSVNETKIVKEKITLKAFAPLYPEVKLVAYDAKENVFTQWLEEQTNIHLDWEVAPSASEAATKLSLLIQSGKMPDICFQNAFTPSVQQMYGSQKLILPLNDYIEEYGKNTKKMFEEMPVIKEAVSLDRGNIYVLPSYAEDTHMRSFYKMWIYKPWLDKLKLPIPKTTDEFIATLTAFRDKDPNGNGKKDEIPLLGCTAWNSWNPTTYFMNAFTYYDPNTKMQLKNGKIVSVINTPEYKQGLQFMRKLYDEKLMSAQTFTMDFNQFKQTVEGGKDPLVGVMPSHAPFVVATKRYKDYVPMDPLIGPSGVQFAHYNYITNNMGVVISAKCQYPAAAFRLLDYLYDEEVVLRCTVGRKGQEWDYAAENEGIDLEGKPAVLKDLRKSNRYDQNEGIKNINWYTVTNYYKPASFVNKWLQTEEDKNSPERLLVESTKNQYMPHQPSLDSIMPQTIVLTEEESSQIADVEVALSDYIAESFAEFALGIEDINKGWDKYVKQLDTLGLQKQLEIYQKAIDRRK